MNVVHCVFVAVRPTKPEHVAAASLLEDESPMLCQRFRKALLESPQGFSFEAELEGFPLIHLEWHPLGQTAGVLSFPPFVHRPNRPGPDVLSLLLNGVESPEDLSALAKRFPLRADIWQEMLNAQKPVAFNLMFTVGRLREPATVTIINAFANSFFTLFGTNEAPDSVPHA
jgi:hypothetical protein